jgi:Holliday junction resolvasome RuvABC endonuclease subunit
VGLAPATDIRSIGIRVSPRTVFYAVVERHQDEAELLTASSLAIPAALETPDQLSFVRTTLLDIMSEYAVRRAGIRVAEHTARQISILRFNLEGVVQELLSSSGVEAFFAGRIATIAALLGERDRSQVKRYFEGQDFLDLPDWDSLSPESREAVVTAVAALSLATVR